MTVHIDVWIGPKTNPKKNHVIKDQITHSWTRNYIEYGMRQEFFQTAPANVSRLDVDGIARVLIAKPIFQIDNTLTATPGIFVGTSNAAFDANQNKLQAVDATMVKSVTTINAAVIVGGRSQFSATRVFTNGSGAAVTVREIGLHGGTLIAASVRAFLIERTVLPVEKIVPDGQIITVTYTFKGA